MIRKSQILLVTHLLALVLGYGAVWRSARFVEARGRNAPEYTKLAARDGQPPPGDGDELLADFLNERSGKNSPYAALKATLPVAKDLRGAVASAIQGLGGAGLSEDEQAARLAEVEVRVFHWMKVNPIEAVGFVMNDPASEEAGLPALLDRHVFRDVAAESGVLNSAGWLMRNELTFGTFCEIALGEIRAGGGFALFEKLDEAVFRSRNRSEFREFRSRPLVSENPAYDGVSFLRLVGGATRFDERDKLLERAMRMRSEGDRLELLEGFAESGGQAAGWVLGILERGELKEIVPEDSLPGLEKVVLEVPALDLEKRLAILRKNPDSEGKSGQELADGLADADVGRLLAGGRDWRYEFRSGKATAEDVLRSVRSGLPNVPEAGQEALRVSVYRQLAEEDPKRALELLAPLPEDKSRAVLLNTAWLVFGNVSPDYFLRFLTDVPDARTPEEQELKIKGWNTKARGNLWRYGDDYVEWVKAIPPGIHQEAAMNSVIWATSEQHPGKARELSEQFYPRNP